MRTMKECTGAERQRDRASSLVWEGQQRLLEKDVSPVSYAGETGGREGAAMKPTYLRHGNEIPMLDLPIKLCGNITYFSNLLEHSRNMKHHRPMRDGKGASEEESGTEQ